MTEELSTTESQSIESMNSLEQIRSYNKQITDFYNQELKKEIDYGIIPGVAKPSLFKPGAEKIRLLLNLSVTVDRTGETLDITQQFYDCSYKATVKNMHGTILAECEGSCNTFEDKYRYVYETVEGPQPPTSEAADMVRLKKGRFKTIDGIAYWQLKVENMSRLAIKNTIQKMAQKRAIVGAILLASGASSIFTQDFDDNADGLSPELVSQAMEELNKVATPEDLKALVARYENVYNGDEKFKAAAKEVKQKLKTNT